MSGMGTGLNTNNPTIVSAFHRALLHQGLVVLAIVFLVALAWNLLRSAQLRAAAGKSGWGREAPRFVYPEAPARRLLRVSFGLLWIFDGILQGQASMPLGMGPQVIQPAAAASPTWVQHLDQRRGDHLELPPGRRRRPRRCGSRSASGCGCWPPPGVTGPGSAGWPASGGA